MDELQVSSASPEPVLATGVTLAGVVAVSVVVNRAPVAVAVPIEADVG